MAQQIIVIVLRRMAMLLAPLILAGLLLWPALVGRAIPLDVTGALTYPPWEEARPDGCEPDMDRHVQAAIHEYFPDYAFISANARTGECPLWNPMPGCGIPFLAMWRTRCLSPFSIPFYFLPLSTALAVSLLLKLAVAGWAAYYAARRFGLTPPLALAAAVAFELSGPMILWHADPMSDALPWMPLLLLVSERLGAGFTRGWPQSALLIGLMALGGGPQILAAALCFTAVFTALRMLMGGRPGQVLAALLALCISAVVALAVAGVQFLPYVEWLKQAARHNPPQPDVPRLADFVATFFVSFRDASATSDTSRDPCVLALLQIGLVQVWLLALWLAVRRFSAALQRRRMDSLLLTLLLAVCFACLFHKMPLGNAFRPEHLLAFNALAAGFISAAAAAEWLVLNATECRYAIRRGRLCVAVLLVMTGVLVFANAAAVADDPWWFVLQLGGSLVLFLFLLCLLAATLLRPSPRIMGYGLCGLTILAFLGSGFSIGFTPRHLAFPETQFIKALQGAGVRMAGAESLAQWPVEANGVPRVYTAGNRLLARQAAFLAQARENPRMWLRAGSPMLVLTGPDIHGPFAPLRSKLTIRHVFPSGAGLFECIEAKPRVRLAYETRSLDKFDPALLDPDRPPLIEHPSVASGPGPEGRAALIEEGNRTVKIEVETGRPAVLILADTWYPGWKAAIDGRDTDIFPVDGMFRGIEVPEGKHTVTYTFSPATFRFGLYTSFAAIAVIIVGFWKTLSEWFQARKNRD